MCRWGPRQMGDDARVALPASSISRKPYFCEYQGVSRDHHDETKPKTRG
jgi:hypothetical protein